MEFQDEDRICFQSHYFLDDESARKLSYLNARARTTTNKEKGRSLVMRANSLVYRGYLCQLEKVGEL